MNAVHDNIDEMTRLLEEASDAISDRGFTVEASVPLDGFDCELAFCRVGEIRRIGVRNSAGHVHPIAEMSIAKRIAMVSCLDALVAALEEAERDQNDQIVSAIHRASNFIARNKAK